MRSRHDLWTAYVYTTTSTVCNVRHWLHVENKCLYDKNVFVSVRQKSMIVTLFKPFITCKMIVHELGFIIIR